MISASLAEEGQLLLHSLFQGMLFMAVYDGLRVFRGVLHHSMRWINIEDFLYWIAVGAVTFRFLLQENDGVIRWYVVAGIGAGMLVWSLGISRLTVPVLTWILRKVVWGPIRAVRGIVAKGKRFCDKHRKS